MRSLGSKVERGVVVVVGKEAVSVEVTHKPLREIAVNPSLQCVSFLFLLIRMGDRGGFNKFGGK